MTEIESLMLRYVGICNRAIEGAAVRFPFSAIIASLRNVENLHVRVQICGEDRIDYVGLCLSQGYVSISPITPEHSTAWSVPRSTLQDTIDRAVFYSGHPEHLNWEWVLGVLDQPALSLHGKVEEQAPQA